MSLSRNDWNAGWPGWLLLLALLASGGSGQAGAPTPDEKEQNLKAAFVYNFTKFVDWPAASFPSDSSPLIIGVTGSLDFARAMELAVAGRQINARSFEVRQVATLDEARAVHLLFCSGGDASHTAWLATLKGSPVLTVGESTDFLKAGGVINFVVEGDKVRFDISRKTAEASGLKISSQLLRLARKVEQ